MWRKINPEKIRFVFKPTCSCIKGPNPTPNIYDIISAGTPICCECGEDMELVEVQEKYV